MYPTVPDISVKVTVRPTVPTVPTVTRHYPTAALTAAPSRRPSTSTQCTTMSMHAVTTAVAVGVRHAVPPVYDVE